MCLRVCTIFRGVFLVMNHASWGLRKQKSLTEMVPYFVGRKRSLRIDFKMRAAIGREDVFLMNFSAMQIER